MAQESSYRPRVDSARLNSFVNRSRVMKFVWAWSLVVLPATASLAATDPWKNAKIMPRNDQTFLMVGTGYVNSVRDVSWPATVLRREGQWLWISDRGGYQRGSVDGWIRVDDILKQSEAQDYYSEQLQIVPTGALYWLRGITWEVSGDKDVAIIDYQQAVKLDDTLVDAHVRLGRLEADSGQPRSDWEAHFKRAKELKPNSPQVHFSWAEALRSEFSRNGSQGGGQLAGGKNGRGKGDAADKRQCFCDATKMFSVAKDCDPSWPFTHLGLGQLLLASAQDTMLEKLREMNAKLPESKRADPDSIRLDSASKDKLDATDQKTVEEALADAIDEFNQAIQWNPQAVDAYRDRGEAYRLAGKVSQAVKSADKACKMLDYRASYSLKVLAAAYYDSSNGKEPSKIEKAITYATKAAQFAPDEKRPEFKQDRDFYIAQLAKQPNTAVRSPGAAIMDDLPRSGSFSDTSSAARMSDQSGVQAPAPSQFPGRAGISESLAKSSGTSAPTLPSPAAIGPGLVGSSAAGSARTTYYAIPDLVPTPLGGIAE